MLFLGLLQRSALETQEIRASKNKSEVDSIPGLGTPSVGQG